MLKVWVVPSVLCFLLLSVATYGTVTPAIPRPILQRRQSSPGTVTGVTWRDENGNVGLRREISDLQKNYPDQWNLYLLGLARIQWKKPQQGDLLSYFGLANIHGRPYQTWGDSPGIPAKIGAMGYCPHNNVLFMGWHRPYLALFEEQLYKAVQEYANEGTIPPEQRQRWKAAANSFRMPFWDWALGPEAGSIPEFLMQEKIMVEFPHGGTQEIWNPLYAYYFDPIPSGFDEKWVHLNSTQRWPTSDDPLSKSQQSEMVKNFNDQRRGLHDHVELAFRKTTMNEFADEIEKAHGWVHGVIGGGWTKGSFKGHMWPLEYSSYEPLFWLHHATVDRFFAMYQAMYPDIYFTGENVGIDGNVWIENDSEVDATTALLPFRKATGEYWTTNDVRSTTTFGYAYVDTFKPNNATDKEHIDAVKATVARLYGSSARAVLAAQPASAGSSARLMSGERNFTDWTIRVSTLTSGLPAFVVRFRLCGDRPGESNLVDVGALMKLKSMSHEIASKPESIPRTSYEGSVSLTATLLEQIADGRLRSLEEWDVRPFLNEYLHATITADNGKDITPKHFDAFIFEVVSSEAHIPLVASEAVTYSEPMPHPDIAVKASGVAA